MKQSSVIVIGAGIAGITTAAHLAQHGMKVTVFEKNQRPGGRCDYFIREGHRFDTGPTLLIMPKVYEAEFAALGTSLSERLELQRVDPTYHLVFDDGSHIALTSDMKALRDQVESIEPGSFAGLLRYLQEGQRHYDAAMAHLVNRDFRRAWDFFSPANIPLLINVKPLVPHYRNMSSYFKEPRLKAAFTFQDVYMGLSPFEAPATFSMMPYTELAHGVWYPKGGMSRVVDALVDIATEAGVEFVYETAVEQIDVHGKQARGVVLEDGRYVAADIVIANADLPYVYQNLLPDQKAAKAMENKRYSCSVISFFWGVDKVYSQLGAHTLFLADDYRENFVSIIDELSLPQHPSLYIHAPTRLDSSLAPEGEDTLIAIVPVGHMGKKTEQDWVDTRERARQAVFDRLAQMGITDLQDHIKFETNYTPLSWRKRYNLVKGATHGLSHTLMQLAYMRPHNRHARYHNVYFAGASTHPGTGVPTALICGHQVADRVMDDLHMSN
ncbi:phytoene desaturase [Phototrophicus methaneseepsis]|uniref:Phytoene desaturase n=1 Tax=Phototrophicus methaneseepsis TaxID=2710758 RepID=A0A7S8E6M0_9CHLR|nr:phytoene desaturase family protein [Phototrophicus methaneseepsis]QPC81289.1 phytoene desaturase [Phototrophicus methaneseepsis]